jgi:two-component system response regulator FixJ
MAEAPCIYVVDDDPDLAAAIGRLLERHGHQAIACEGPQSLLASFVAGCASCIVTDVMMVAEDGFSLACRVRRMDPAVAFVFTTASPTTADAVEAIRRHGGIDYLDKPIDEARLLAAVEEAMSWSARKRAALDRIHRFTRREREVFELLVLGLSNKAVAARLNLSPKTVEDHRAAVMHKTGAESLAELITIARAIASPELPPEPTPARA